MRLCLPRCGSGGSLTRPLLFAALTTGPRGGTVCPWKEAYISRVVNGSVSAVSFSLSFKPLLGIRTFGA